MKAMKLQDVINELRAATVIDDAGNVYNGKDFEFDGVDLLSEVHVSRIELSGGGSLYKDDKPSYQVLFGASLEYRFVVETDRRDME